jgi:hypothetical protein
MNNEALIALILAVVSQIAIAANITVSGPTTVCPGVEYTYTASASNAFGSQAGCFQMIFRINGVDVGYAGGITCPCGQLGSSFSANFTWPSTGNFQVYVRFLARNWPLCEDLSFGSLTGLIRVVVPSQVYDTNGGLSFCSSGQTRTISVPNVPYNNSNYCMWHHAYDWIVPSGWTVVPTNPSAQYTTIEGGIRTHATSVNVTAPSSTLATGFTGNYFITVRTEPEWPWPREITRQIWVGSYGTNLSLSGTAAVCSGNLYTYSATPPGGHKLPGHTYSWTKPSNWTIQAQQENFITLYVPQYNPNYGPVQVSVNNGCGTSQNGITTFPGYGCGGYGGYSMSVYPNPTQDEFIAELVTEEEVTLNEEVNINEVRLTNSTGEVLRSTDKSGKKVILDIRGLPKGQYFIHVRIGDQVIKEQVFINR